MIVNSGSGLHGYWALWPAVSPDEAEAANRRLAKALGADPHCVDAARILRPPGTYNFKTQPPRPVELVHLEPVVHTLDEIVGHLPEAADAERWRATPVMRLDRGDDPLLTIAAETYVPALTGREVGRDGKVQCPFHGGGEERTPSLHVYPDDRGWFCFGCERGGTIYDLGALIYGLEPRGAGFHEIRRRLAADLLRRDLAA
jgi:hypothetical protein